MRSFCIILFLCCSVYSSSQDYNKVSDTPDSYFCKVETEAYTNYKDWKNFLIKTLGSPLDSLVEWGEIPAGEYKVWFRFIVDKDGSLKDIAAEENPYGLGQMAVDAAKRYPNKWIPAEQNGRKVKAYRRQPIIYQIEGEEIDSVAEEVCHSLAEAAVNDAKEKALPYPPPPDDTALIEMIIAQSECDCAPEPPIEPVHPIPEAPEHPMAEELLMDESADECMEKAYVNPIEWRSYLEQAIIIDSSLFHSMKDGAHYRATVKFIVESDGRLSVVKRKNREGDALAMLFEKAISNYQGQWRPAMLHGIAVRSIREQWLEITIMEDGTAEMIFAFSDHLQQWY